MKLSARNLFIGLVSALLLVLANMGAVLAAETPEASADADNDRSRARIHRLRDRDGGRFARAGAPPALWDEEALLSAAAEALGMTADELRAAKDEGRRLPALLAAQGVTRAAFMDAMRAAKQRRIDDALQAGTITQEQADRLRARRDRATQGGFGRYRGTPALNLERLLLKADIFDRDILTQAVAKALGMTTAELEAAKAKGSEAFKNMDIDGRALERALRDARRRMINSALESGAITQEQANRLDAWMDRGPRRGFGHRGHHAREFGKRPMAWKFEHKGHDQDAAGDADDCEGHDQDATNEADEREGHDQDAAGDADEREGHDRDVAGDADQGSAG